ncbi:transmembrane protease serine 9-like isoform X2 [Amblyraja radiata]|uniref:transmembrane protease serine 9-like isoform X2 n=1 Tax=Amblyraja radiata TaxID=386614 RepID=UPI00140272F1|nr:transmembrane protease serine 9-like isoform X2 [Amblyraja radiata]
MTSVNVEAAKTEEVRTLIPTTRVLKILAIISVLLFVLIATGLVAYVLVFYLPHKCTDSEACRRSEYTACGCGQRKTRSDRIVGGSSTYDGEWPFIVSLQLNRQHSCGATLISCRWILSAAHCFRKGRAENWVAVFGVHFLDQASNNIQTRTIKTIKFPSNGTTVSNYDVALLELSQSVEYTNFVQPACLPAATTPIFGQSCTTIGWGQTNENVGSSSNELLKTEVNVYNNIQCQKKMPTITPHMICAGAPEGGRDACQGDSGGPLLCQDENSHAWIVAGVVSSGVGCGRPEHPGIYTQTAAVQEWIKDVIQ